jgi:hypothetical protein
MLTSDLFGVDVDHHSDRKRRDSDPKRLFYFCPARKIVTLLRRASIAAFCSFAYCCCNSISFAASLRRPRWEYARPRR